MQMLHHIGNLPQKLGQRNHTIYDYVDCPPVSYPELADEMWCHRYYLRNLCNTERFGAWTIVDHVPFLQARLSPPVSHVPGHSMSFGAQRYTFCLTMAALQHPRRDRGSNMQLPASMPK